MLIIIFYSTLTSVSKTAAEKPWQNMLHKCKGSRKIAPEENCPPSPNSNANPKPNPDPDRGVIFLGGNFPDTKFRILYGLNGK